MSGTLQELWSSSSKAFGYFYAALSSSNCSAHVDEMGNKIPVITSFFQINSSLVLGLGQILVTVNFIHPGKCHNICEKSLIEENVENG